MEKFFETYSEDYIASLRRASAQEQGMAFNLCTKAAWKAFDEDIVDCAFLAVTKQGPCTDLTAMTRFVSYLKQKVNK